MEEFPNYSCKSATETQHWIEAIIVFLRPYRFFCEAHVVNFIKDHLWESVDKEWIDCLRNEPVEHLLGIPSGAVRDNWPSSLKKFVLRCRSLALPREQAKLEQVVSNMCVAPLNSVLSQGMNPKKKHEVEILAAVINSVARSVDSNTIVDVGSGQGYLAQVLSFQYKLSVLAIDGSLHHGEVTKSRAERIKKHYAANMRKLGSERWRFTMPKTITCRVLSANMLKNLSSEVEEQKLCGKFSEDFCLIRGFDDEMANSTKDVATSDNKCSLVLAGLHACGDLSVTMLRAFSECRQVSALVSIGCCYNLLSEDGLENHNSECGFPLSNHVKSHGLSLGKSARNLACQSAERWRGLQEDAGIQNFDLHAFRAVLQMVLAKYYPQVISASPSIGRQGKALRRQHQRNTRNVASDCDERMAESDKYNPFKTFSESALRHLGLQPLDDLDLHGVWKESEPFMELIGAYWSLRAALGPVVETLLLLDRLLFLQEQGDLFNVDMLPIFDPVISPRNVAIIARKI